MPWLHVFPSFLTAIAVFFLPGLAPAWALRLRGLALFAVAPLFSIAIIGASGILGPWLHLPWSPLYLGGATLATTLLALGLSLLRKTTPDNTTHPKTSTPQNRPVRPFWSHHNTTFWSILGLSIAAFTIFWRMKALIGTPENFSFQIDNGPHLGMLRHILDSGNGSTLGDTTSTEVGSGLYPRTWHSVAALVVQLSHCSLPVAENMTNLAISACIWPLGALFLARTIFGPSALMTLSTTIFSAGQIAFPYRFLVIGTLFPNLLGYVLVPAALATVVILTGCSRHTPENRRPWLLSLPVLIAALLFAHPSALVALLALALPPLVILVYRRYAHLRHSHARLRPWIGFTLQVVFGVFCFVSLWTVLRPPYTTWSTPSTFSAALGDAIFNAPLDSRAMIVLSICSITGLIVAFATPHYRWLAASYAVSVALFVACAALETSSPLRFFLAGAWYQDANRLGALLPITATVLAALGFHTLVGFIRKISSALASASFPRFVRRHAKLRFQHPAALCRTVGLLAVAVVLLLASQASTVGLYLAAAKETYQLNFPGNHGPSKMNGDKLALMQRLDRLVPPEAVIAVSPFDGGMFLPGLTNRRIIGAAYNTSLTPAQSNIVANIDHATPGSSTCQAAHDLHVQYVLRLGFFEGQDLSRGFWGITAASAHSPSLQLIDAQGDAQLFKIVC